MSVIEEPGRPHSRPEENAAHGRLTVRREPPVAPPGRTGLISIEGTGGELLALAFVPEPTAGPYHLVVLLHGAGGNLVDTLAAWLDLTPLQTAMLLVAVGAAAGSWLAGRQPDLRLGLGLVPISATALLAALAWAVFRGGVAGACLVMGLTTGLANVPLRFTTSGMQPPPRPITGQHGRSWRRAWRSTES